MTCHWEWLEGATRSKIAHQTSKKKRNFTDRKKWSFKPFVAVCRSFLCSSILRGQDFNTKTPLGFYTLTHYIGDYLILRGTWGSAQCVGAAKLFTRYASDSPMSPYKPVRKRWWKHLLPSSVSGTFLKIAVIEKTPKAWQQSETELTNPAELTRNIFQFCGVRFSPSARLFNVDVKKTCFPLRNSGARLKPPGDIISGKAGNLHFPSYASLRGGLAKSINVVIMLFSLF